MKVPHGTLLNQVKCKLSRGCGLLAKLRTFENFKV